MTREERFRELVKAGVKPKAAEGIIKSEVQSSATLRKEQVKMGVSLAQSKRRLSSERTKQAALSDIAKTKAEIRRIKSERFKSSFLGRAASATGKSISSAAKETQKFSKSRQGRSIGRAIMGRKTTRRKRKGRKSSDDFFGDSGGSGGFF